MVSSGCGKSDNIGDFSIVGQEPMVVRLSYGFGRGTIIPHGIHGEDGERRPNAIEADRLRVRKWLGVNMDSQEQLKRWGQVLQKPQGGERQSFGGLAETQERNRRDDARQNQ